MNIFNACILLFLRTFQRVTPNYPIQTSFGQDLRGHVANNSNIILLFAEMASKLG